MGFALAMLSVFGSLLLLAARRARWRITTPPKISRSSATPDDLSPVARQHLHLMHGGLLSQSALEAAKTTFRKLLDQGRLAQAETRIRGGLDFVVQVRALAEIGTDDACRILEQQLGRRLSSDPIEQSWYWVDLAQSLRALHRPESLSAILHRSGQALSLPMSHLFAAEVVCFDGFEEQLEMPFTVTGRQATRVLLHALEGLRCGIVPLGTLVQGQLGEVAARLMLHEGARNDGLLTRVLIEAARLARRTDDMQVLTLEDPALVEGLHWQHACLHSCEVLCREQRAHAAHRLPRLLADASREDQRDLLLAIDALRIDAGPFALALIDDVDFPHRAEAMAAMAWCQGPKIRAEFLQRAHQSLIPPRRSYWSRRPEREVSLHEQLATVQALRRHPSLESEQLLLHVAKYGDPQLRPVALAALGWWEPIQRTEVIGWLKQFRQEGDPESRCRARAALARLGERQALHELHYALTDEDPIRLKSTIELVAEEGLTWFWSDLDRLANAEDSDVAYRAREALECLREDALGAIS